jgi:hypothetical protein
MGVSCLQLVAEFLKNSRDSLGCRRLVCQARLVRIATESLADLNGNGVQIVRQVGFREDTLRLLEDEMLSLGIAL